MAAANPLRAVLDVLRKDAGLDSEGSRIVQMAVFVFLRVLDDQEETRESESARYSSPIPDDLRWRSWADKEEGLDADSLVPFVQDVLIPGMQSLPGEDPLSVTARSVFEEARISVRSGVVLRQALDVLDDAHVGDLADAFEDVLRALPSSGSFGDLYTPRALVRFMVDRLDPAPGESIFDPACGTGGFLITAGEHQRDRKGPSKSRRSSAAGSIRGVEAKSIAHLLAVTNLMLRGLPAIVTHADALEEALGVGKPKTHDVLFANPPFGGEVVWNSADRWARELGTTEVPVLYLHLVMRSLRRGGRAAIVVPNGVLFGDTAGHRAAKQRLLEQCDVHTIVRLPAGAFAPHTNIETNLVFLTKGRPTREIWYYQQPPPPGRKGYSKTRPLRDEDLSPIAAWWEDRSESERAWKVDVSEIAGSGYNLDQRAPSRDANRWPSRAVWVRLGDFRGFESLLVELPKEGPAVLIGANGAGKSTVLDAMAMQLSIFTTLLTGEPSYLHPRDADIKAGRRESSVRMMLRAGAEEQVWEMRGIEGNDFDMTDMIPLSATLREGLRRDPNRSVPVLCFYPATRGVSGGVSAKSRPVTDPRLEAYEHAFQRGFGPFDEFARWFREEEDVENEGRLRSSPDYRSPRLAAVRRALERFLNELGDSHFSNLRIERLSGKEGPRAKARLVVDKDGQSLSIDQFSEGERNTLLLAADVARRLAIANPGLADPLQGEGIVLVDEIDLHLHPAWQRNIVPALSATFLRCQFVVSTHSGQVLSRVPRENVFILEDYKLVPVTPHTYGRDANSIQAEVMGVPERPRDILEKIRRAATLVDEERLGEARTALDELTSILGEDDIMVVRLRTLASFLQDAG